MRLNETLRSRPGLNTAIGVVFAVIAGLLLLGYLSQIARGRGGGPMLEVPVAGTDIEVGVAVTEDMIATTRVPSDYLVPGTIRKRSDISGARALRFVARGEPFTASAVAGPGGEGTLASRIPADLRAYSLQLGRGAGAGTSIRPGDRVDVLATSSDPPRTGTLLRERLVLGVAGRQSSGGESASDQGGSMNVTLLVTPAEAEMLAQAECAGEVSVSLCPIAPPKKPSP
jgi:pilus assembly protein CpaB